MSDQPDEAPLPELTPEQESTVRRYLAEVRHTEPLPADVADRLDRVLAELADEVPSPGDAPPAGVVDLATHRRRRNAGRILVAAAAVIVAGVGVGQVIGNTEGSDDSASSSAGSDVAPDRGSAEADGGSGGGSADMETAPSDAAPEALAEELPLELSGTDLEQQVRSELGALPADTRSSLAAGAESAPHAYSDFACQTSVDTSDGTRALPAYVDGKAALVTLTPAGGGAAGDEQDAQVLDCLTGDPLATFTVTLP